MNTGGQKRLSHNPRQNPLVVAKAKALADSILAFRDAANARAEFVRYKILVGFESVYPGHWDDEEYDFTSADQYRQNVADQYITDIDRSNEESWFEFLTRCAQTNSNDLATFPVLGQFLLKLAKAKPEIAERILLKAGDELRRFTPAFLNGLAVSDRKDIYDRVLERELASGSNLSGLARHLRYSEVKLPSIARRVLDKSLSQGDSLAVVESLLFCMEHFGSGKILNDEEFFADAISYLTANKDSRWINEAWFLHGPKSDFFSELTPERSALMLSNLQDLPQIRHQAERLLTRIAEKRPEDVWDYFGKRLQHERSEGDERFDAVPFQFHGLEKELSKNPTLAIEKGKAWYSLDKRLFQFRGGRLLSNSFPDCTTEFAQALVRAVQRGVRDDADFALAVLQNYRGEKSTHPVLKAVIAKYPDDQALLSKVRAALDNAGVVSGELGFVEAYRHKKALLNDWKDDENQSVRDFATRHQQELDNMIASETRRAEMDTAMRRLRFGSGSADENREEM